MRSENIEFGQYSTDGNDTFTTGNLIIGKGGKGNASIRAAMNDSSPESIITPDTTARTKKNTFSC